jgi:hypothetical protein
VSGILHQDESAIVFDENEVCRTSEVCVDGREVLMEIWDIPGEESVNTTKKMVEKSSESFDSVVFVVDFSSSACQRDELSILLNQLSSLHGISLGRKFSLLVVGNKYDLVNTTMWCQDSERSIRSWCSKHKVSFVRTKCVPPGEESHLTVFAEVVRSYIHSFITLPSLLMRSTSTYLESEMSSRRTSSSSSRLRKQEWSVDDADADADADADVDADADAGDRVGRSELFPR